MPDASSFDIGTAEEAADDRFRALASPARRRLLRLVRDEARPVGELARALGVTQPAVSQHLGVLRHAGLVDVRAVGRRRLYRADRAALDEARAWFDEYWSSSLDRLELAAQRRAAAQRSAS